MKLTLLLVTAALGATALADSQQLQTELALYRQRMDREQAERWERSTVALYANDRGTGHERRASGQTRQNEDRATIIQQGRGQKTKVKPTAQ